MKERECIKALETTNLSHHMAGSLASQTSFHPYVLITKQPLFLALMAGSIFQNIGLFSSSLFIFK